MRVYGLSLTTIIRIKGILAGKFLGLVSLQSCWLCTHYENKWKLDETSQSRVQAASRFIAIIYSGLSFRTTTEAFGLSMCIGIVWQEQH